jgi:hypothetical protein
MHPAIQEALEPFYPHGKLHKPLLSLFLLINLLILVNAVLHDPTKGYDAKDHIQYIQTLAEDRRIPTCQDSAQCYIPPLPYMLPAILLATGQVTLLAAAKLAQLVNVLLSLALTYYVVKICALLEPDRAVLRISSLAAFGILPVFYKTYALIRGEVYLPLLAVFIAYLLLSIFVAGRSTTASAILLGSALGLALLARQWGLLAFPAVFIFVAYAAIKDRSRWQVAAKIAGACLLFPVLVAGWYYGLMWQRYGTLTAWDRPASKLSPAALPPEFYFGLGSGRLFTDPIRPSFSNQLPAIFYADTWGDYSAYFLVYIKDKATGRFRSGEELERLVGTSGPVPARFDTNRFSINSYLGRVNLVSLLPSLILAAGLAYGIALAARWLTKPQPVPKAYAALLFSLVILFSLAGYGWYLLRYQNHGQAGDLIKATHMMQIFPFLGLLGGQVLGKLERRSTMLWWGLMILLGAIALHNIPAMVTHYPRLP